VIDLFEPVAAACRIHVPASDRRGIAIVGAGAIVDVAHLPAYRSAGLDVVGIVDLDITRARAVADRHGVEHVYRDLDEMLCDDRIEVVDVAVPAQAQPDVARRVLHAGRHMLGQKPFAPSVAAARDLVRLAQQRDLVLAVNQQLRYDEGMMAAHAMVALGWLGELTHVSIDVDIWTEWTSWPWMIETPELEIWNHSIHYHDVIRWLLGEPDRVYAVGGRTKGQAPRGETRSVTSYHFESGATALVTAHHENSFGDPHATFRLDGDQGSVRGTLGLLYDYPSGRPDTVEVMSRVVPTDGWVPYPVTHRWIPDAFVGPMAALLDAVSGGSVPLTSALDNLATLGLVEAIYSSMHSGEVTHLLPDAGLEQRLFT